MIYLGSALLFPVATSSLEAIGDYGVYVDYLTLGLKGLEYTVATTTVLSGLSYVFPKCSQDFKAIGILDPFYPNITIILIIYYSLPGATYIYCSHECLSMRKG